MSSQALLVTGRPGCGKTTLLMRALERSPGSAGGFYTQEVRVDGVRQGFDLVTLDGQVAPLARVGLASPFQVGKYGVDLRALDEVGVEAIRLAMREGKIVVVDEIGSMELKSEAFRSAVMEALDGGARLLATVTIRPHPWVDTLKRDPRVELLTLTPANREGVLRQVVAWLEAG